MLIKIFSLLSVAAGFLLLGYSLKPACQICRNDKAWGWKVLAGLILSFMAGYAFFLIMMIGRPKIDDTLVVLSMILFGGAIFVSLIVPLALNSILSFNRIAQDERHQSLHDNLTGLPNRKFFIEQLRRHVSLGHPFAVLVIDLNNFKEINDGLGHYLGDKFLAIVASELQNGLHSKGECFRLGGDEFALITKHHEGEALENVIENIHRIFEKPISVMTYAVKISASIGVSFYPKSSEDAFGLMKQADLAMYESKSQGALYSFYHSELGLASYERLKLSLKLADAIKNDEFKLHYQPIISGSNQQLSSFEVLIRWPQRNGAMIPPDKFIPIAESSMQIFQLTRWVIQQACHDLIQLRASGFTGILHINLSAKDLQSDEIVHLLDELLADGKITAGDFIFEVTEGAVMKDLEKARQIMNHINKLNADQLSID